MEDIYKNKYRSKSHQKISLNWLEDNKKIFNEMADGFGIIPRYTGIVSLRNKIRKKVGELIIYKNNLLDVGVGNGMLLSYLKKKITYVGIDISDKMLELAKEKALKHSIPFVSVLGNAVNLPFPDNSFDTVICIDTFHHIPEKYSNRVLDELFRVARPNGQILLEIKNKLNVILGYQYYRTHKHKGLIMNPVNPFQIKRYFKKKNCTTKAYFPIGFYWLSPFILFDIRLNGK